MIKIIFVEPDGKRHLVSAPPESNLMQCAVDNMIPGIEGACGGCCSCATCHAYVDEQWLPAFTPLNDQEDAMLDCVDGRRPNSRLLCQLELGAEADGVVVQLAADGT